MFAQFQKKKDSLLPITLEHPSSTISFCFCKNLLYHLHMCHETASRNNTKQNCLFLVFFDHIGQFRPLFPCCYRIVNISYFLSTFPFFLFMIKNVIYTRKCGHQILQHFFILSKRLPFFVHFLKSTQISRSGLSFCLQVQLATPSFISEHRYMYRTGRQIKPE